MGRHIFRFKQFQVNQEGCAMKINTDGVLIGALARLPDTRLAHDAGARILDIGTGTGVIALMLAQRFPQASVDAVEIDHQASITAAANFSASPFAGRLRVQHTAIEDYQHTLKYDLIVSNPPYFVNDLKNPEQRKSIARHASEDFFTAMLRKASGLLSDEGLLWLILPVKQAGLITGGMCREYGLYLKSEVSVRSDSSKPVIRKIICLGGTETPVLREEFCIYDQQGIHSNEYQLLLKDFFLAY